MQCRTRPKSGQGKSDRQKQLTRLLSNSRCLPPFHELLYLCGWSLLAPELSIQLLRTLRGNPEFQDEANWKTLRETLVQSAGLDRATLQQIRSVDQETLNQDTLRVADQLHHRLQNLNPGDPLRKRLLEKELLLRGDRKEDWRFCRALWTYRVIQSEKLGPPDHEDRQSAVMRARDRGILFHPDQPFSGLGSFDCRDIRAALCRMSAPDWAQLLDNLLEERVIDVRLPKGFWPHIRPYLHGLMGGRDLHCVEFLPTEGKPPLPENRETGMVVLHAEDAEPECVALWTDGLRSLGLPLLVLQHESAPLIPGLKAFQTGECSGNWLKQQWLARIKGARILPLREYVQQVERQYILDVLGEQNGVKSKACECLGISRQTLYTKLATDDQL